MFTENTIKLVNVFTKKSMNLVNRIFFGDKQRKFQRVFEINLNNIVFLARKRINFFGGRYCSFSDKFFKILFLSIIKLIR